LSLLQFNYLPEERVEYEITSEESFGGWIFKSYVNNLLIITSNRVISYEKRWSRFSIGGDSEFRREIPVNSVKDVKWEYSNTIQKVFAFTLGLLIALGGLFLFFSGDTGIGVVLMAIGGAIIYYSFEKRFQVHFNLVSGTATQESNEGRGLISSMIFYLFFAVFFIFNLITRSGDDSSINLNFSKAGFLHVSGKHVTRDQIIPVPNVIRSLTTTFAEVPAKQID
jgi:hypothetical protein